jgi:hypothetical protein
VAEFWTFGNIGMSTWMIIALVWFVVGLLCWAVILRFFPPTPLVDPRPRDVAAKEQKPRPFSIRDVPVMALFSIPIAALSPPLLLSLFWHKLGKQKNPGSK